MILIKKIDNVRKQHFRILKNFFKKCCLKKNLKMKICLTILFFICFNYLLKSLKSNTFESQTNHFFIFRSFYYESSKA